MIDIRIAKVILYPMAAVVQIFVVPNPWLGGVLAIALVGLAILNLRKLLAEAAPAPKENQ